MDFRLKFPTQLSPSTFLADWWQKKPLRLPQGFPGFSSPVSPAELFEISKTRKTVSRLVIEKEGDYPWQVRFNPLSDRIYSKLPETNWTVLVQEMNRLNPDTDKILDAFSFIPGWRLDDIMVSYAVPGGSVGPHTDQYDVFLIQGMGRRKWHYSTKPPVRENWIPDMDIKLLANPEFDEEWIMEPGDILYLPPGVAHHGVALDHCLTFSVGFRTPAIGDFFAELAGRISEFPASELRLKDPEPENWKSPGFIRPVDFTAFSAIMSRFADSAEVRKWYGLWLTRQKRTGSREGENLKLSGLGKDETLRRAPGVRMAWTGHGPESWFFADGTAWDLNPEVSRFLAENRQFKTGEIMERLTSPGDFKKVSRLFEGKYFVRVSR
ncbi:MAG: cupin domain-containing protein [Bacteroidetes bacterium]|nr:cupin domain-containing protein [Bacteroidota bacterium]